MLDALCGCQHNHPPAEQQWMCIQSEDWSGHLVWPVWAQWGVSLHVEDDYPGQTVSIQPAIFRLLSVTGSEQWRAGKQGAAGLWRYQNLQESSECLQGEHECTIVPVVKL